jgi:hypothetical protein
MDTSSQPPHPFERIEEYKAVLEDTAQASNRRRTDNTLFVGLNTVFLTGIGLFASSRLASWDTVVAVAIVAIIAVPVNMMWYRGLAYWMKSLAEREEYIRSIERGFRARSGAASSDLPIGLYLHLQSKNVGRMPSLKMDQRFALFFALVYPLATLALAVTAYALQNPTWPLLPFH